jgi:hypothetical protein
VLLVNNHTLVFVLIIEHYAWLENDWLDMLNEECAVSPVYANLLFLLDLEEMLQSFRRELLVHLLLLFLKQLLVMDLDPGGSIVLDCIAADR